MPKPRSHVAHGPAAPCCWPVRGSAPAGTAGSHASTRSRGRRVGRVRRGHGGAPRRAGKRGKPGRRESAPAASGGRRRTFAGGSRTRSRRFASSRSRPRPLRTTTSRSRALEWDSFDKARLLEMSEALPRGCLGSRSRSNTSRKSSAWTTRNAPIVASASLSCPFSSYDRFRSRTSSRSGPRGRSTCRPQQHPLAVVVALAADSLLTMRSE